jgi:NADH-quinone oxidoreductase subunit M
VIPSAVYMLWMFQRVNYGEITNDKNRTLPDLSGREWALMIPTIAICVLMGVAPGIFLKPMEPSVLRVIDRINGVQHAAAAALPRTEDRGPRIADLDPRPSTPDPRPSTLDPRPSTLDPRPSTLDPRPSTLDPRSSKVKVAR